MALLRCCHRVSRLTKMQHGGHMQSTETKGLEEKLDDGIPASAGFSGIKKRDLLLLRDKPVFLDPQLLNFRVQRRWGNSEFRCRTFLARNFPFTFRKGPFNNFSLLILESVWQRTWQLLPSCLLAGQPSLFDPKGIAAGQDHRSFKCFAAHGYFPAMHTIGTAPAYCCRSCKCTCRLPAFSAHGLT